MKIIYPLLSLVIVWAGSTTYALEAGAARVNLVPPTPATMGGYFDRKDPFEGVSTPIYARALVVSNEETTLGVVVLDLCYVSRELTDQARVEIEKQTGIPGENIVVSATHTHSAPSGFMGARFLGRVEQPELSKFLLAQTIEAVVTAYKNLEPAQAGFAYGDLPGMTRNRQQENDLVDPQVGVLKVQKKDSREYIAVLANYTGHPVILGGNNLLLSSEFPGAACTTVEDTLGGVAILTQGACGDVTVHRSGDAYEEVKRVGRVLGGEIIKTAEQIRPTENVPLFSKFQPVDVEPRDLPSVKQAQANINALEKAHEAAKSDDSPDYIVKKLRREVNAANTTMAVARGVAGNDQLLGYGTHTRTQVIQIGDMIAVAIPGEMFVEYQLEIKHRIAQDTGKSAIVIGYANDYIGYIITPRADKTGGYEKAISRVAASAGRTLTEAAIEIVQQNIHR
ncbi:MAG: neutral/alkaline non-lysosomal ceramidase N-terminal domain-containing protein [Candidatus Hydrogenedentota bacterium]